MKYELGLLLSSILLLKYNDNIDRFKKSIEKKKDIITIIDVHPGINIKLRNLNIMKIRLNKNPNIEITKLNIAE